MQQSSERFSTLLSNHIISMNTSGYFYKSWLWCLEAIWVFTISAEKQLILQVPVLWLSPDAFWCRSASTMSGTFFASLHRVAVLLKRLRNPNDSMILCITRPSLDPSDLCKQGIDPVGAHLFPQSAAGPLGAWLVPCSMAAQQGSALAPSSGRLSFAHNFLLNLCIYLLAKTLFPWVYSDPLMRLGPFFPEMWNICSPHMLAFCYFLTVWCSWIASLFVSVLVLINLFFH